MTRPSIAISLAAAVTFTHLTIAGNITTNNGLVQVSESSGNWLIEIPSGVDTLVTVSLNNDVTTTPDDFGVITIDNQGSAGVDIITPFKVGVINDIHANIPYPVTLRRVPVI